jgi:hypothetical protein
MGWEDKQEWTTGEGLERVGLGLYEVSILTSICKRLSNALLVKYLMISIIWAYYSLHANLELYRCTNLLHNKDNVLHSTNLTTQVKFLTLLSWYRSCRMQICGIVRCFAFVYIFYVNMAVVTWHILYVFEFSRQVLLRGRYSWFLQRVE